jgi:tetratricopeptide (TPR) repeat protein
MAAAAPAGEAEKLAGNAHFKAGEYLKAAASYTKAIKADPSNHALFSNRAQAFLKINKVCRRAGAWRAGGARAKARRPQCSVRTRRRREPGPQRKLHATCPPRSCGASRGDVLDGPRAAVRRSAAQLITPASSGEAARRAGRSTRGVLPPRCNLSGARIEARQHTTCADGADPSHRLPCAYHRGRARGRVRARDLAGAVRAGSQVSKALEDADKCIALAPDFVKGYHRKVRRREPSPRAEARCRF